MKKFLIFKNQSKMIISIMEIIRDLSKLDKDDVNIAGGKGASLGEMIKAGISVPSGFVILASVFEKFLEGTDLNIEINSILDSVNHKEIHTIEMASEKIITLILRSDIPKDISNKVIESFTDLNTDRVAVRSSATSEDSSSAAWAGQLDSYLNTTEENLLEDIKKCWASLFTPRAIFYRFEKGFHDNKISVAVVIQKMVQSEAAGIAFSVHPVTQDPNQLIIEAGLGLGDAVVSGRITPDSYVVEKEPRRIIDKNIQNRQILTDDQIVGLSDIVLRIERHYGFPCDIEWAIEKSQFYIVQSRPITTLSKATISGFDLYQALFKNKKLVSLGKRPMDLFVAKLRVIGWTDFLKKEIDFGYDTLVINSDGEMFVNLDEDDEIRKRLQNRDTKDAFNYISKIDKLKNELLHKSKGQVKDEILSGLAQMFAYFLIARTIVEEVYEQSTDKERKKFDVWRDSDPIYDVLDSFHVTSDEKEWTIIYNDGALNVVDRKLVWHEESSEDSANIIKGRVAYPGIVKGRVRIIMSKDKINTIQDGEILVSNMTTPEYLPALKKAAAFVTDEGGVTSHAAIIAREMKKPCIIGTKNATKKLKDGDEIEVDAINGIVKILK